MSKATANTTEKKPWLTQFDDEISEKGEGSCEFFFAEILKDFLILPEGDSTTLAANTAREIVDFQEKYFLPSDPLMRFQDDQGWGVFLWAFYETVFTLARLIPYHDNCKHDKLVRLMLELRKLPPRTISIWQEECLVWTREPVFVSTMDDSWNGNHPVNVAGDLKKENDGDGTYSFQELCDQWVNFSSYLARCLQAGLNDNYPNGFKHASIDIREALDEKSPPGPGRDSQVMVAAQYILLAGEKIAGECVMKHVKGFGLDEWNRWAERLGEISREESNNTALAAVVEEAHQNMVSRASRESKAAFLGFDEEASKLPERRV